MKKTYVKVKKFEGIHPATCSCSPSPCLCFPALLFILPLFLLLYICPTALAADAAADAAEVAAPRLLLPLSPLPPRICTLHEMRVEGDGVMQEWWWW